MSTAMAGFKGMARIEVEGVVHILGLVRCVAREVKEMVNVLVNGLSELSWVGLLTEGVELLFAFRAKGVSDAESVIGCLGIIKLTTDSGVV